MADMSDEEMGEFLRDLDKADFEVTEWEAQFIASNLDRDYFTPKQREAILRMAEKYGDRV